MLTWLFLAPAVTALLLLAIPRRLPALIRMVALVGAIVTLGLVLSVAGDVHAGASGYADEIRQSWIPGIGSSFHLGVDGLSIWLLALNALLGVVAIAASDSAQNRFREHMALLLLLEAGMAGVFMALDLILFYFFWEAMLIPAYFIIGIFGRGRPGAALKFVLYTLFGSLLMLVAMLVLYFAAGRNSFDVTVLAQSGLGSTLQFVLFGAFALAFAIKAPILPFHGWLPDTYEATPAADLVLIAGVMGKTAVYSFLRFGLALFPQPHTDIAGITVNLVDVLAVLSALTIVYGAWLALNQTDMKRMVAFSSVSHLGFICLGVFSLNRAGLDGAVLQSVNHGLIVSGLFLLVHAIERRTGSRQLPRVGWLAGRMPVLAGVFALVALAALGLPGLNGFVGEFLIMLGAWQSWPVLAVIAGLGVTLAAVYMLRLYQRSMQGESVAHAGAAVPQPWAAGDLRIGELLPLAPLCILIVALGVYPQALTSTIDGAGAAILRLHGGQPAAAPVVP